MTNKARLRIAIRLLIENENRDRAGGFVIFRRFADGLRVLGLTANGSFDIPKGRCDPDDKDIMATALRELREETGISALTFPWGTKSVTRGHITAFMALTEQDAIIVPNPETGVPEHEGRTWLPVQTAADNFEGDLTHIVGWAVLRTNTY